MMLRDPAGKEAGQDVVGFDPVVKQSIIRRSATRPPAHSYNVGSFGSSTSLTARVHLTSRSAVVSGGGVAVDRVLEVGQQRVELLAGPGRDRAVAHGLVVALDDLSVSSDAFCASPSRNALRTLRTPSSRVLAAFLSSPPSRSCTPTSSENADSAVSTSAAGSSVGLGSGSGSRWSGWGSGWGSASGSAWSAAPARSWRAAMSPASTWGSTQETSPSPPRPRRRRRPRRARRRPPPQPHPDHREPEPESEPHEDPAADVETGAVGVLDEVGVQDRDGGLKNAAKTLDNGAKCRRALRDGKAQKASGGNRASRPRGLRQGRGRRLDHARAAARPAAGRPQGRGQRLRRRLRPRHA